MLIEALFLVVLVATALAVAGWLRARHWRRSYLQALQLYRSIPQPRPQLTPHQRGAETARARRIERMRAHRMALQASMTEQVDG